MIHLLVQHGSQLVGPGVVQYKRAKELATKNGHYSACRLLESLHDERLSKFELDPRDIMQSSLGRLSVPEDQGPQTEIPDAAQGSAFGDLGSADFSLNDFTVNADTFFGQFDIAADVNEFSDFTSFLIPL